MEGYLPYYSSNPFYTIQLISETSSESEILNGGVVPDSTRLVPSSPTRGWTKLLTQCICFFQCLFKQKEKKRLSNCKTPLDVSG